MENNDPYHVIGQSTPFLTMMEKLSKLADIDRPILIRGERGSGKESIAHRLHYLSKRWEQSFLTLNCGSYSLELLTSELFGHEKGAFTGADTRRAGQFEAADGGTLFLDEIANSSANFQEQVLRAIEYGTFRRVGSNERTTVDVRILAATHENLGQMAQNGEFRRDLLDRLAFAEIVVPPLRERHGDEVLLSEHFAKNALIELGLHENPVFSKLAQQQMKDYPWPGNIRELRNTVERSVFLKRTHKIDELLFMEYQKQSQHHVSHLHSWPMDFEARIEQHRNDYIQKALEKAQYNQKAAAELLGLSYDQFRGWYRKFKK